MSLSIIRHYSDLTKTDRDAELVLAALNDPKMPHSRKVTSVPFIGKDTPSQKSEWSHPDIIIGLTILAFRHEGLRRSDVKLLMKELQQTLWQEVGPWQKRGSSILFEKWIKLSGGKIRGSKLSNNNQLMKQKRIQQQKELKFKQEQDVE